MSCILRISGETLDIDALLVRHPLSPHHIWRKGSSRSSGGKIHTDSGANFVASGADLDEFQRQVDEAAGYLEKHVETIAAMAADSKVQSAVLDFGVCLREGYVAQFCHFPPKFIQLVAKSGLALEVSHYACSESED